MQCADFGRLVAVGAPRDPINGYSLVLAAPVWLNELLDNALPRRVVEEAQIVEANLLVYLQYLDDAQDRQSQTHGGDPSIPLAAAQRRLGRLFAPGDGFWRDFARLEEEQRGSARAKIRAARSRAFDRAFLRTIAAKAALVRWPASAMARLAGQPAARHRLDELLARFLAVVLLFDDLTDVEDDAREARNNALLQVAGGDRPRDPFHLYPALAGAARLVCSTARAELSQLRRELPARSGFARACGYIERRTFELEKSFARACQLRLLGTMAKSLADSLRSA